VHDDVTASVYNGGADGRVRSSWAVTGGEERCRSTESDSTTLEVVPTVFGDGLSCKTLMLITSCVESSGEQEPDTAPVGVDPLSPTKVELSWAPSPASLETTSVYVGGSFGRESYGGGWKAYMLFGSKSRDDGG